MKERKKSTRTNINTTKNNVGTKRNQKVLCFEKTKKYGTHLYFSVLHRYYCFINSILVDVHAFYLFFQDFLCLLVLYSTLSVSILFLFVFFLQLWTVKTIKKYGKEEELKSVWCVLYFWLFCPNHTHAILLSFFFVTHVNLLVFQCIFVHFNSFGLSRSVLVLYFGSFQLHRFQYYFYLFFYNCGQ